jgi:N-acetylmuramoyl-L-alanine amidase
MPQRTYRRGDDGPAVAEIRDRLGRLGLLVVDPPAGVAAAREDSTAPFDDAVDAAVRQFQQVQGLRVDGMVGAQTFRRLDEARWALGDRVLAYTVSHPMRGDDVAALQQRLSDMGFDPGRVDGIFGPATEAAVRRFQRNMGLIVDGTCGPTTLQSLGRLQRTVTGGKPVALREHEAIRRRGPTLAGKIVVIDPGHGGADTGAHAHGLVESVLTADLAARIEGRLSVRGAHAFLTRPVGADDTEVAVPADVEARAEFANAADADLLVSLHVDHLDQPEARGVATYYYGGDRNGAHSAVGERLAALVQHEIVTRTDLLDCRIHAKTWDLLRATRMPAVRIEIGYLSHPGDAARLADPVFRDTVAEAVVTAVSDLYTVED